jgi:hypothetical protein
MNRIIIIVKYVSQNENSGASNLGATILFQIYHVGAVNKNTTISDKNTIDIITVNAVDVLLIISITYFFVYKYYFLYF